jgi:hypothetical protein
VTVEESLMVFNHCAKDGSNLYPSHGIRANNEGAAGIGFDFLSELTYKDAKVLPFFATIRSPYGLEEAAMPEGLPLVCYEES